MENNSDEPKSRNLNAVTFLCQASFKSVSLSSPLCIIGWGQSPSFSSHQAQGECVWGLGSCDLRDSSWVQVFALDGAGRVRSIACTSSQGAIAQGQKMVLQQLVGSQGMDSLLDIKAYLTIFSRWVRALLSGSVNFPRLHTSPLPNCKGINMEQRLLIC